MRVGAAHRHELPEPGIGIARVGALVTQLLAGYDTAGHLPEVVGVTVRMGVAGLGSRRARLRQVRERNNKDRGSDCSDHDGTRAGRKASCSPRATQSYNSSDSTACGDCAGSVMGSLGIVEVI